MTNTPRRALIDTPDGQLHLRTLGAGPTVVLLHWTPGSGRQYAAVLPELAALGYRVLAPDHMGFGNSDPRPRPWSIADFADNIAHLIADQSAAPAFVVGGHLSSEIAVELALRHPKVVRALVLDGSPVWSRERRDQVLAVARPAPPAWSDGGDHIAWAWQRAIWLQKMWDPAFALDNRTAETMKLALAESLLTGEQTDATEALRVYDLDLALPRLTLPVLALSADTDPLRNCHDMVLKLASSARGHVFAGSHPLHNPARAGEYVGALHRFFADVATAERR